MEVKRRYKTEAVRKEDYPEFLRNLILTEAFAHTVKQFVGEKCLAICLGCGKWFVSHLPQTRVCSPACRNFVTYTLNVLHGGGLRHTDRRLRQSPLYLFLYLAVKRGILPPQLLGEERPEDLPHPLFPLSDITKLVEVLDIVTATKEGNEVAEGKEKDGGDHNGE